MFTEGISFKEEILSEKEAENKKTKEVFNPRKAWVDNDFFSFAPYIAYCLSIVYSECLYSYL